MGEAGKRQLKGRLASVLDKIIELSVLSVSSVSPSVALEAPSSKDLRNDWKSSSASTVNGRNRHRAQMHLPFSIVPILPSAFFFFSTGNFWNGANSTIAMDSLPGSGISLLNEECNLFYCTTHLLCL